MITHSIMAAILIYCTFIHSRLRSAESDNAEIIEQLNRTAPLIIKLVDHVNALKETVNKIKGESNK
jgi:hypothetical protein